jgi:hypothetical protein
MDNLEVRNQALDPLRTHPKHERQRRNVLENRHTFRVNV